LFTTRPEIKGTFGIVTSTHWLATAAGMAVLEKGGNAFDAAVATAFSLQVVEPHKNGLGGEVPILLYAPNRGKVEVVCGQGVAPSGATIQHFQDLGLNIIPGTGLLATTVPGAFDAWMLLLRDYGTLHPRDVMSYAIEYAAGGYSLIPPITEAIQRVEQLFRDEWTPSAKLYLPGGNVPQPGSLFRNTKLAETYDRLLSEGEAAGPGRETRIEAMRRAWSQGFIADEIDQFCRTQEFMDTSGRRHGGILTGADMSAWQATVEAPLTYDYGNYSVCKCGPWSQGPVFLQQLALLKEFDLSAMDPQGPEFVHVVLECAKLALADRDAFYGDPDFVDVPLPTLLSDTYNNDRRALVDPAQASQALQPGQIPGYSNEIAQTIPNPNIDADMGPDYEPTVFLSSNGASNGDTCHIDVIDRDGNMIAATPSGSWLFSSPIIPELGFSLNSRAQMFWLKEELPTSLAPGKRPRTTLSPSLAMRDGEPFMVFGTPGADTQDQHSLIMFLRTVHHGMNLQEAIDAPMFHTAHAPASFWPRAADLGSLFMEDRFPAETITSLREKGHRISVVDGWSLGRLCAASRDAPFLKGAAFARFMQGYAAGR
jgi:gamma-glutamyltranspeptidase/glutathione hydrolase